jgi:hypothetical protein
MQSTLLGYKMKGIKELPYHSLNKKNVYSAIREVVAEALSQRHYLALPALSSEVRRWCSGM